MLKLADHLMPYLAFSRCTLSPTDWLVERTPGTQAEPRATLEYDAENLTVVTIPVETGYLEQWQQPRSREDREATAQRWTDILGNRARIELETVGHYLPQDLNYDLNGTVSFTKGCYTGQEIIARLHYRGTPKRRLHRAQVAAPVASGDALIDADNRSVGSIVNHCKHSGNTELLIELVPAAAAGRVTLRAGGEALTHISPCHDDNDQSTGPR
jgi:folate-binding protein YgfZ